MVNISIEIILGMPFLTFSNADVQFAKKKLTWRTYITEEALPITCRVKLIDQKECPKAVLNENIKAFVVYVSSLELKMIIHQARKAQLALLLAKKVTVLAKYSDFANMFLEKSTNIFSEQTQVNEHVIELEKGKQPSYRPIYSLGLVELKTLKTYIETNLANSFIKA